MGHPRPLRYRAEDRRRGGCCTAKSAGQRAANLPLGVDDESSYDQFSVSLGRGDLVVFYTDALVEAMDEGGRLLGEKWLGHHRRRGIRPGRTEHPWSALPCRAADRHRGGGDPDDDVTLLVLRHTAEGPKRLTAGEKLDVYARVFGLKSV